MFHIFQSYYLINILVLGGSFTSILAIKVLGLLIFL